jgi:hypothetical protein
MRCKVATYLDPNLVRGNDANDEEPIAGEIGEPGE